MGLDDDTFNIVATARFTPGTAPARAAQTARILAATGRPFAWWVGPASSPDNLTEHLQASRSTGRSRRGYEQADINDELARGDWAVLASGMPRHAQERAIGIRQRDAAPHVARMQSGQTLSIVDAPFAHLYFARGGAELEGAGHLGTGDAVRVTGAEGQRVTAGPEGAEILMWEMHAMAG